MTQPTDPAPAWIAVPPPPPLPDLPGQWFPANPDAGDPE
jgi:hypothetical protein